LAINTLYRYFMDIIEIQTLIDITGTGVTRPNQGSQLELDQQRNFITLMQCVELRSIVTYNTRPVVETVDVKGMGFGTEYKGKHSVWTFRFSPDRQSVYNDNDNNPVGGLIEDIQGVPVIKNLTETVNISTTVFELKNKQYTNTIIKALQGTI